MPTPGSKSLLRADRPSSPTPESRFLAQQAFRYEIGVLRAWENVRQSASRAADPRFWIRRHPLGAALSMGAVAAILIRKATRPLPPKGIFAALRRSGASLIRRAAASILITGLLQRLGSYDTPCPPDVNRRSGMARHRAYPSSPI